MNKKFLAFMFCVSLCAFGGSAWAEVIINPSTFPDENFRNFIATTKFDKDSDGHLSDEEIAGITTLNLTLVETKMESLNGIEYLTALKDLDCYRKGITGTLDLSQNLALESIRCYDNSITTLTLGNNTALKTLECGNNRLRELDIENNTALKTLTVNNNRLATLDFPSLDDVDSFQIFNGKAQTITLSPETLTEEDDGYKFDLRRQLSFDVDGVELQVTLIEDLKAFENDGNEISVDQVANILSFDKEPLYFTYNYNVGLRDNESMDVRVNFSETLESESESGGSRVTSVASDSGGGGGCDSGFSFMGLILVSAIAFRKRNVL